MVNHEDSRLERSRSNIVLKDLSVASLIMSEIEIKEVRLSSKRDRNRFAFWFSISFILNGYATGIPGFSLGSLVLVIYSVIALLVMTKHNIVFIGQPLILIYFFSILSFLSLLTVNLDNSVILNSIFAIMKLFLWALMLVATMPVFWDEVIVQKWMNRIALFLTIYIIVQSISFYGFSIYLPNIFDVGILRPYAEGYADYEGLSRGTFLRPASLLSESSFYGNYIICVMVLNFGRYSIRKDNNTITLALFYSVGIILSTSTAAIILLPFIWIAFINEFSLGYKLLIVFFCIISVFIVSVLNIDLKFLENSEGLGQVLYYSIEKFKNIERSSRFGRSYAFIHNIIGINSFIGVGIGNGANYLARNTFISTVYMNSVTTILVESGYFGMIGFVLYILNIFLVALRKGKDKVIFILLFIYIIKGFSSGIYFSTYGILFLCVIYSRLYKHANQ